MANPYVAGRDLVGKLEALLGSSTSLMLLGYELKEEIRETLAEVERLAEASAPREVARRYMATAPQAEIRATLIEARGSKAAANFRTRLNSDLEARNGRRHPAAGTPRVPTNGDGAHAV